MHIVGIDPGIVHTGVVVLDFDELAHSLAVTADAIPGFDEERVADHVEIKSYVFAEKYKPRSHFTTDKRMVEAEHKLKTRLPKTKLILNTGVTKVVRREVMELFHVWKFSTVTHHQDLRSAARIALYGALKDDDLNRVLYQFTVDHLEGRPWHVTS